MAFGCAMARLSFYPDGRIGHGAEQFEQSNQEYGRAWHEQGSSSIPRWNGAFEAEASNWWREDGRRASWTSSTFPSGSTSEDWSGQSAEETWGKWFWTPELWVWGATIEEAVQDYVRKGWLTVDSAFIEWWSKSSPSASETGSQGTGRGSGRLSSGKPVHEDEVESVGAGSIDRGGDRDDYEDSRDRSSSRGSRKPCTGKDFIPSHPGNGSITMREYERRARLFQATTGIDPEFQAGKLVERLSGEAWSATENLNIPALKCASGVDMLLKHLWDELEPLEFLKTFNTLAYFYKSFKRQKGQEMTSYDSAFRAQCKRLEEVGSKLEGTSKAYWYLEKASISDDLRRQVVSSAGAEYDYGKLRSALVAIVPQVKRQEGEDHGTSRWHPRPKSSSNRVHAVDQDEEQPMEQAGDGGDPDSDEPDAEQLELEAEVLLTHAARKRAEANRNRGFAKRESSLERNKRISEMKKRMPCAACKSKGITAYGHWHGDPECPSKGAGKPADGARDGKGKASATFVVTHEDPDESESEDAFLVHVVFATYKPTTSQKLRTLSEHIALADTCCARTVVGWPWVRRHVEVLADRGLPFIVVPDSQPFRFGDGPKVRAREAIIFPIYVGQCDHAVLIRASIVMEDVPLLMSSSVLKAMGAVVDLAEDKYVFKALNVECKMTSTGTGHIGFKILECKNDMVDQLLKMDWQCFVESGGEIAINKDSKDRVVTYIPLSNHRGSLEGDVGKKTKRSQSVCAVASASDPVLNCDSNSSPSLCLSATDHGIFQANEVVRLHEEGRVCEAADGDHQHGRSDSQGHECGEASTDSQIYETGEIEGSSCKLETIREVGPHRTLHGEDSPGQQQVHGLHQGPVDCGSRSLCRRSSRRGSRTRHGKLKCGPSLLHEVSCPDGGEDKPSNPSTVLGLCGIPEVQGDHEPRISRTFSSRSSHDGRGSGQEGNDGVQEPCGGESRGDERNNDSSCNSPSSASRDRSQLGSPECSHGVDADTSFDSGGQGGCDQGRDGVDHQLAREVSPVRALSESEIRDRIARGQKRRKLAKAGTVKRWIGNCRSILSAACMMPFLTISAGSCFVSQKLFGDNRPDVVEIFGGAAEVSFQFSRRGWNVLQPLDLVYGFDLRDPKHRDEIRDMLERERPRLAIVEYPCTLWTQLASTNYRSKQEKRRLARRRREDEPFLELCEDVFNIQLAHGDDALAENPLTSLSFKRPPIQRILNHPDVYTGVSHGCRFGVKSRQSGLLLKKPVLWISSSVEICDELSKRCPNTKDHKYHDHGECQGGKVAKESGVYTKEIARAIHKGFVRLMMRKDSSRVVRMLKAVRKRLGMSDAEDYLAWKPQKVEEIINKVWAVGSSDAVMDEIPENPEDDRSAIGQRGVMFAVPEGRKLDSSSKAALRKIHCNLGHPGTKDLQRFLRNAGATQEQVEAVAWIRCAACAKSQRPRTHRTVRLPPHDLQFNDQIMVDCFHVKDVRNKGRWFMSMLDRATMYHQVSYIDDHSPETFVDVFMNRWIRWAGTPEEVSIDLERGFGSQEFASALGEAGVTVVPVAGQAHWQHGKIERHGGILKTMIQKVLHEIDGKKPLEVDWAAQEVTQAKNMLAREHGFSPSQLVFGKEPRAFGEIEANGDICTVHFNAGERHTQLAKRMKYRCAARQAYINAQAQELLSQSARNRTRTWKEPQIGDRCFFYREVRRKGVSGLVKAWHGPATVVGLQGQSNVWLVFGGKCFLVASEHCREAVGEEIIYSRPEVQEMLTLFKEKGGRDVEYEDLTQQGRSDDATLDAPVRDTVVDSDEEILTEEQYHANPSRVKNLPDHLLDVCREAGWHVDGFGNPVQTAYKAFAFRTPVPRFEASAFPFRTSWGLRDGKWRLFEEDIRWSLLEDSHELIPGGNVDILLSVFSSKTRKQHCEDDFPMILKRQRVQANYLTLSQRKAQRALDKEVPFSKIPEEGRESYHAAEVKEWNSWLEYDAVSALSPEETKEVLESRPERVLKCRFVYRNKNNGLVDHDGKPLELKAKARLCVQGQNDPDCMSGEVKVDAPTVQHGSLLTFLHCVVSFGWVDHWRNGDVSSAFLQGEETQGEPLYMFPPQRGLPGISSDQILRLRRPVYGRPDAPRAWYEQISKFIMGDMGFERSILDPALFVHRDGLGNPNGMLVLHVDDLMVATDGSEHIEQAVHRLFNRFPFGEWDLVKDCTHGVTYCGKEIRVGSDNGERTIVLGQKGFSEGRLETVPIEKERKQNPDAEVTEEERSDFRSVLGSLQWLSTQSRPDISFGVNQLQKRVNCLTVRDLEAANKLVRIVKQKESNVIFRNLGKDVAVVSWHDAGLYNSLGVELDEDDNDLLQSLADKKLLYSQKGCVVGLCKISDLERTMEVPVNYLCWKSKTNRRVLESSFAAETHAALMGYHMGQFQRTLLMEIYYGEWAVKHGSDFEWEPYMPLRMMTDCKSVFDTIKRDSQSVGDKSNCVNVAVLRQLCVADPSPKGDRARMMWVPTRHQLADPLTKGGRHHMMQENLAKGCAVFHGLSAKRCKSKEIGVSVKVV